jgi:hypothetical protein
MEPAQIAPLTPEQLAAVTAGGGFARFEDPTTHVQYQVIQIETTSIDDDYIRAMLAEAQADVDAGRCAEWNVDEIKREVYERLANRQSGKG